MLKKVIFALVEWVALTVGTLVVFGTVHPSTTLQTVTITPVPDPVPALSEQYGCSTTGLGNTIPGGAIITVDDTTSHVSFDRGWASYEGTAPGVLVSVCVK